MICALVTGVQTCALPISQIAAIRPQYDAGIFGRNPVNRSATGPSMVEASPPMAPEWTVSRWFNADGAPSLQSLRGRVVFLHAFQMLCPACVQHRSAEHTSELQSLMRISFAVFCFKKKQK